MRRFTVMGFTEAELGFVMAALFIAVAATAVHERDASAVSVEERDSAGASLRAELSLVRDSFDVLRGNFNILRDSLMALETKMSTKVPQCWERGEQSAPVADVAVLGANLYEMDGQTVTIDEVRQRLAPFIERSSALRCRFVVRARPTAGIDAVQQSSAVWQLRQHFDVNDRPQ